MAEPTPGPSPWAELFRGPLAVTTLLVNLGVTLHAIDIFVITTVMPTVVADIGGVAYYAWAVTLYVVGSIVGAAGFAPLRVALGDRAAYGAGGLIFLAGTVICGLAPDIVVLLVGRTVQGAGAGIAMAGSYAMIGTLFAPRLRPHILTTTNVTWTIATFIGPTLGGVFADLDWWRGAFWAVIPFVLIFIAVVWWKVPASSQRPATDRPAFPFVRLALLAAGIMCVAMSGSVESVALRALLIAAAIGVVWYSVRQDARAPNRMFPSHPLSVTRPVGTAFWTQFLVSVAQTTLYIYPPLVLQARGLPALYAGAANGLLSIGWSCGAGAVTAWKGGLERWALVGGLVVFFIGLAAMAYDLANVPVWFILLNSFVIGIGVGMQNVHMVAKSIAVAEKGEENITSSSLATVRSLGVAFGSAISGLVANMAGLDPNAGAASVVKAVTWVYIWDLVPIAASLVLMLYFLRMLGRRAPSGAA